MTQIKLFLLLTTQHAIGRKFKNKEEKHEHWIDFAGDKFDRQLIQDIKQVLRVLLLYVPIPVFWALFDQQVNRIPTMLRWNPIQTFVPFSRVPAGHFKLLEWTVLLVLPRSNQISYKLLILCSSWRLYPCLKASSTPVSKNAGCLLRFNESALADYLPDSLSSFRA